jgi:hypothetical protein
MDFHTKYEITTTVLIFKKLEMKKMHGLGNWIMSTFFETTKTLKIKSLEKEE